MRFRAVIFLTALLALSLACTPAAAPTEKPLTKVRASLASPVLTPSTAFFWIGMHPSLGYFAEEGIEAEWRGVESASQTLNLLIGGDLEIGGVGPEVLLNLAAQGKPVPAQVAYVHNRSQITVAIVREDSPIKSWADVAGKRVGTLSLGTQSAQWYTRAALREVGADPDSVEFLAVGQDAPAAQALADNRIDVYVYTDNNFVNMKRLGFKVRTLPEPQFAKDLFYGGLTVNTEWASNNQELMGRFLRAIAKGSVFTLENPRAAIQIHYDLFPENLPKGKSYEEAIDDALEVLEYRLPAIQIEGRADPRWGAQTREQWDLYAYSYMGLTKDQIPDVSDFFTTAGIPLANDFDAEKIREQARNYVFEQ